jgi:hypothetical protein
MKLRSANDVVTWLRENNYFYTAKLLEDTLAEENTETVPGNTDNEYQKALLLAGKMADAATNLVGGQGLNSRLPHTVNIDNFTKLAQELRKATEKYNEQIISMSSHSH